MAYKRDKPQKFEDTARNLLIQLYYTLIPKGKRRHTYEAMGDFFNVSRQRVEQIVRRLNN